MRKLKLIFMFLILTLSFNSKKSFGKLKLKLNLRTNEKTAHQISSKTIRRLENLKRNPRSKKIQKKVLFWLKEIGKRCLNNIQILKRNEQANAISKIEEIIKQMSIQEEIEPLRKQLILLTTKGEREEEPEPIEEREIDKILYLLNAINIDIYYEVYSEELPPIKLDTQPIKTIIEEFEDHQLLKETISALEDLIRMPRLKLIQQKALHDLEQAKEISQHNDRIQELQSELEKQLNTLQELQEQIDLSPTIMQVIRDLQENMELKLIEIINEIIFLLSE